VLVDQGEASGESILVPVVRAIRQSFGGTFCLLFVKLARDAIGGPDPSQNVHAGQRHAAVAPSHGHAIFFMNQKENTMRPTRYGNRQAISAGYFLAADPNTGFLRAGADPRQPASGKPGAFQITANSRIGRPWGRRA
jgi:hypothetical protein